MPVQRYASTGFATQLANIEASGRLRNNTGEYKAPKAQREIRPVKREIRTGGPSVQLVSVSVETFVYYEDFETPLIASAMRGHLDVVNALICAGVGVTMVHPDLNMGELGIL